MIAIECPEHFPLYAELEAAFDNAAPIELNTRRYHVVRVWGNATRTVFNLKEIR